MAKKGCLDCIEKHEKSKQRQRNAKKRQKKKEQLANPAPIIRQTVLPPPQQFRLPTPTQNDLTFFQRAQELDTLVKLLDKKQQRLDKESDDYYKRVAKANPQFVQTEPTPEPKPEPTLERKPRPRTANEAVSNSLDYFGEQARVGIEAAKQTPSTILAPVTLAGSYLSTPFQFLGGVASSIGGAIGGALKTAAEPETLERTAPAVGGNTPEIQFIGSTGRILESSPVEQGANPLPSVFLDSPPSFTSLTVRDRRPRTRIIPEDEIGGEGGSRFIEQQRRLATPYPLAPPEYQVIRHNRVETSPPLTTLEGNAPAFLIGQPPLFLPETEAVDALGGEQTVLDLALRPQVDAPIVPNPDALYPEEGGYAPLRQEEVEQLLTPEEEATFQDASGEEEGGYAQEEELPIVVEGIIEEGVSPELPLEEAPPTVQTSQSLATGLAEEQPTLSPRALTRQTTEELAATVEDLDVGLSELQLQKEYDKQKKEEDRIRRDAERIAKEDKQIARIENRQRREEAQARITAERETARIERERVKAEKDLRKRVEKPTASQLQIPGLRRRDVANTPKLSTFFRPQTEELQYARLAAATRSVPASQLAAAEDDPFKVEKLGKITLPQEGGYAPLRQEGVEEDEEPQRITFTQPTESTFKFAEGGGV